MEASDEKLLIPRFNDGPRDNFVLWKLRMTALMENKGVLPIVFGTEQAIPATADEPAKADHHKRKAKAAALLVMALGNRPLKVVQKWADDPKILWDKLVARFASKTTSTKLMLLNEVFNLRFTAGSSMSDHVADLELSFTKLSSTGQEFNELLQVSVLLSSIAGVADFEPTVAAIRTME